MYEFVELQRSRRRPLRAQSRSLGGCERSLAAVDVLAAVSCIDPQTAFHRFVLFVLGVCAVERLQEAIILRQGGRLMASVWYAPSRRLAGFTPPGVEALVDDPTLPATAPNTTPDDPTRRRTGGGLDVHTRGAGNFGRRAFAALSTCK